MLERESAGFRDSVDIVASRDTRSEISPYLRTGRVPAYTGQHHRCYPKFYGWRDARSRSSVVGECCSDACQRYCSWTNSAAATRSNARSRPGPDVCERLRPAAITNFVHTRHYFGAHNPVERDHFVAAAYPQAVERIARATRAPDTRAAAALLFEGLLQPGFDPARGAEAARRYVNSKATIAILNHRKTADGAIQPWERLGVSERRYYKLLNQFAPKTGTRFEVDADVLEKIRSHLISRDEITEKRAAAMELLQERGFSYAAARKWLQRPDYSEALTARPRSKRPPTPPDS